MFGKDNASHTLKAVHGRSFIEPDPDHEIALSERLKGQYGREGLIEMYGRFSAGEGMFEAMMRRVLWRGLARRFGNGVTIGSGVGFRHLETFDIGDGVFIGAQSYLQGRFDGTCLIGKMTWIGPHSFLDARDLVLGDYVGWGPGAKVLGSQHTGVPVDEPIIQTDLQIKQVKVDDWADIGTNSTLLPGIHVGKGSIIGAGAVVVADVEPFSIVVGVPARFQRWREGFAPSEKR